jgi:tRNA1(Val) A37 N6-methylase TrmN6
MTDEDLSYDAFLGGKLHLWQPARGYRAGADPVFLAASVDAMPGQSVLDLGCGIGTAALCLGARVPDLRLIGVERQPYYADLARRNGLEAVCADLTNLPLDLRQQQFDHVIANPPYYDRAASVSAADAGREGAMGQDTELRDWLRVAAKRLKPKGYAHFIHRIERLPDLLAAANDVLGSIEVLPLVPRVGRNAELVILHARKDGRADFKLFSPLILHSGERHVSDRDSYAPEIKAILRDGAALIR